MTSLSGLDDAEARTVAEAFGVTLEQVRRDHVISLILAALSDGNGDQLVFFGGTALARTHLPHGRLSEDIDLLTTSLRSQVSRQIQARIDRALRRTHGRPVWNPPLDAVRDTHPAALHTADGLTVRIQLLTATGYPTWPTETRALEQRYTDAPTARLRVPTRDAFTAWKIVAWHHRSAPRDLYDLWALAEIDAITTSAAGLFTRYGPTGGPPREWMFATPPTEDAWRTHLAGQTRLRVTAQHALRSVRTAWQAATFAE